MGVLKEKFSNLHYGQASTVSLAVAFISVVAVPFQSYFSNRQMFDYGLGELLPEILLLFVIGASFLSLVLIVAEAFFGKFPILIALIAGICMYLEVSALSIGMPQLNGELWLLARPSIRLYLDVVVVLLILVLAVRYRRRLYDWMSLVAIGLIIMGSAFMMDVGKSGDTKDIKTAFDDGFCPAYDMVRSMAFSTNRNVIVISIDSAPADLAAKIMQEDVMLRNHFPGFIEFRNNIGMHDCTTRGTPAFVTGSYLEKDTTLAENEASFWGDNSAVKDYLDAGYNLFVRMGAGKSYTNRRTFVYSDKSSAAESKWCLFRYTNDTPYITLFDVVCFRIVPYRRKLSVINKAIWRGDRYKGNGLNMVYREWLAYPFLKKAEILKEANDKCFCLLHTEGVHVPIVKGRHGEDYIGDANSREAIEASLHYILELVADLMDSFRNNQIYDNSMIVLSTDHGIVRDPKSALLWVKPLNSTAPFDSNSAPTSHSKIAKLLKESVTRNLTSKQVIDILSQKERKLRIKLPTPEKWWYFGRVVDTYDVIYDESGNEVRRVNLGEFTIN